MRTNRGLFVAALAIALLALAVPAANATLLPGSYLIEVAPAPSSGATTTITGYVSYDQQALGSLFLAATTSGAGAVQRLTGAITWDDSGPNYPQLKVEYTGTPDTDYAPWVAATFTAPRGKVWAETGNQYLFTYQSAYTESSPPPHATWRGSSAEWGSLAYQDYTEQGNLNVYDTGLPTPPVGPGFAANTEPIWGFYGSSGHYTPSYLDAEGTLIDGTWLVSGSPVDPLPTGSHAGISTVAIRATTAITNLTLADAALTLVPGDATYNMGEARELSVTQVDGIAGSGAGYTPPVVLAGSNSGATGIPENYAVSMKGYVLIPDVDTDGDPSNGIQREYSFDVASNDGARLKIGDTVAWEVTGTVAGTLSHTDTSTPLNFPAAGYWPIELTWFQDGAETNGNANIGVVVSAKPGNFPVWDSSFVRLGDTGGLAIYTSELAQPTLGAALTSGPPVYDAGLNGPPQGAGDGLRVQQAPIAGIGTNTAARNFFADKVVFNGSETSNGYNATFAVVRQDMNMADPQNAGNGNWTPNNAFPNDTSADDNYFGTRINGLFYADHAGTYSFTVGTDDSFWLRVGTQVLGTFDAGRGIPSGTANQMYVNLPAAGLYPVEFYSHEGNGGSGIELTHSAETTLLVSSRNPNGTTATVDWSGVGYSVTPVAMLQTNSTSIEGKAYAESPVLGAVNPEHWKLDEMSQVSNQGLLGTYYNLASQPASPDATFPPDNPADPHYPYAVYGQRIDWGKNANAPFATPWATTNLTDAMNFHQPWGGDNFGVRWTGYINIPDNGAAGQTYSFNYVGDDRAWIFIDTDGVTGFEEGPTNPTTGSGTWATWNGVTLSPGLHEVEFRMKEWGGAETFNLQWDTPLTSGTTWEYIPATAFVVPDGYEYIEWLLLAEDTGAIGDLFSYEFLQTFAFNTEYTLRLTVDIAGLTAIYQDTFRFIPEPTSLVLLGGGLLAVIRRRRRNRRA